MITESCAKIVDLYTLRAGISLIAELQASIRVSDTVIRIYFDNFYTVSCHYKRETEDLEKKLRELDDYYSQEAESKPSNDCLQNDSVTERIKKLNEEMEEYNNACRSLNTSLLKQIEFLKDSKSIANDKTLMLMETNERIKFVAKQIYLVLADEFSSLLSPPEWKNLDNEIKKINAEDMPYMLDDLVKQNLNRIVSKLMCVPFFNINVTDFLDNYKDGSSEKFMELVDELINSKSNCYRADGED